MAKCQTCNGTALVCGGCGQAEDVCDCSATFISSDGYEPDEYPEFIACPDCEDGTVEGDEEEEDEDVEFERIDEKPIYIN